MFCHNCGTEIPENARFCVKCGNLVEKDIPIKSEPQAVAEGEQSDIQVAEQVVTKANRQELKKTEKTSVSHIFVLLTVGVGIILLGLMIFLLSDKGQEGIPSKNIPATAGEKMKAAVEDILSQMKQNTFQVAKIRSYYADVLTEVYYQMMADEGDIDGTTESGEYLNKYAIVDVDGDGVEELIVSISGTFTAGMTETVYEYDIETGTLITELVGTPSTRYYSNGAVASDLMHNQGRGLDFWPYIVYVYDTQSDTYVQKSSVDTWAKERYAEDFPDEIDKNGDGVVYYLEGISDADETGEVEYKDNADYDAWYESYFGDGIEIEIPWEGFCNKAFEAYTQANISVLIDRIKVKQQQEQIDMGLFYMEHNDNYEKVEELLSGILQIEISGEDDSMIREGQYNGETVYCTKSLARRLAQVTIIFPLL
ncbi:MAG: zinc ribbon domain-containing protein [Clostridiales bacterium]|nr:zinc ribbon domain-containing protein [Clostridiales bacterium]